MKRFLLYISILLFSSILVASCYQDLSTEATSTIPEITVEGVDSVLNVVYGEEISMTAKVRMDGRTKSDFDYKWEIDFMPGNIDERILISEEPSMTYKVSSSPSSNPYYITLTATDHETGLSLVKGCKLFVSSALGEGLLVAYTRDGGKTSDFDLITNKYLTYGYTGNTTRYTRNIYSLANDGPLNGRANALLEVIWTNMSVYNTTRYIVGTSEHIISIEPLAFKYVEKDASLFNMSDFSTFNTSMLFNIGSYMTGAVINGQLFGVICHTDCKYSKLSYLGAKTDVFRPGNVAYNYPDQGSCVVFDENAGRFFYIMGWQFMSGSFTEIKAPASFELDGATSIGAGGLKDLMAGFLLKDKAGKYHLCLIDGPGNEISDYLVEGEEMDKITATAFCDNANLMYYVTSTGNIYSVMLSGGSIVTRKVRFTPENPKEKITGIRQYTQGWYGTHQYYVYDYPFPLETNRLQMIVTTYDESSGEGKIYLHPFNVNTGNFTYSNNGVYSGFGEITSIASTFK